MKSNFKNLVHLLNLTDTKKRYLIFLVFLIILSSLADILSLGLVIPYVGQLLNLQNNKSIFLFELNILNSFPEENLILILTIFLTIIFFLKSVLSIILRWMISSFSFHQYALLQVKLLSVYQNMKYEDHTSRSTTDYIKSVRELCRECNTNIELNLKIISEIIIIFVIILFLGFINYKILLFFFSIIFPVFLIYEIFLRPINKKLGVEQTNAWRDTYNIIDNSMRGFKETRILGKESFFLKRLEKFANIIFKTQSKSVLIIDSPRFVFEFIFILVALMLIYFLSTNFNLNNYIPLISAYLVAAIRLLPSVSLIAGGLTRLSLTQHAVNQIIYDITNLKKKKTNDYNNKLLLADKFENLKFKNVSFSYKNTGIQVFKNANFELKKNDCVGIIGQSGEGKTTFVDIILGFLKPQKGQIKINDISIQRTGSNFSENVAYLPQEPIILDDKIITNITFENDKKKINYENLNNAIQQANLSKVIEDLPDKIETLVGDRGVRLSGGQNKRLALSRAFYHGKKIFVMDEATSSLDEITENKIAEEIKNIKGKVTIIIISHSKNILKYCDYIYTIKDQSIKLL
jgi:ABC-type bacteriocin/lantibiotic exporter with double-glycine peptidase domain